LDAVDEKFVRSSIEYMRSSEFSGMWGEDEKGECYGKIMSGQRLT
jgi:hypothetical protein